MNVIDVVIIHCMWRKEGCLCEHLSSFCFEFLFFENIDENNETDNKERTKTENETMKTKMRKIVGKRQWAKKKIIRVRETKKIETTREKGRKRWKTRKKSLKETKNKKKYTERDKKTIKKSQKQMKYEKKRPRNIRMAHREQNKKKQRFVKVCVVHEKNLVLYNWALSARKKL